MRVTKTFDALNEKLSTEIRRQYPMVYNDNLNRSFDKLTSAENLEGNLAKIPYIEGLPQYQNVRKKDYTSGLNSLVSDEWLGEKYRAFIDFMVDNRCAGFFDPYEHQAQALKAWANGSDIIVSTGTGSGKTECFLWPIAGHLHDIAERAKSQPDEHRGMKAIILYPMNALVADQLKRLRSLFGRKTVAENLSQGALRQGGNARLFQFGQYTGRTKFHGSYAKSGSRGGSVSSKVGNAASQFETFVNIRKHESTCPEMEDGLYEQMMDRGLIPAKGEDNSANGKSFWDMSNFSDYRPSDTKDNVKLITEIGDRELYFRHEMHNTGYSNLLYPKKDGGGQVITPEVNGGGTPDVLVTNYSMLEYMLKRPLEHGMFAETKDWIHKSKENKLMLVLDEAHLYQGALGTEVGLLVRRLLSSLGILDEDHRDKVQFILTSASLGDDAESKEEFVHGLTGRPKESKDWSYEQVDANYDWEKSKPSSSLFIRGTRWVPPEGSPEDNDLILIREYLLSLTYSDEDADDFLKEKLEDGFDAPNDEEEFTGWLRSHALFRRLYYELWEEAKSLDVLADNLLGAGDSQKKRMCMESILNMVACLKGPRPDSDSILPLLGIRAHLLYRGLPRLYWNLSRNEILLREDNSFEVSYPIRGCRRCGAPYISMWVSKSDDNFDNIYSVIKHGDGSQTSRTFSRPIDNSVRIEVYLYQTFDDARGSVTIDNREVTSDGPAHIWVNTTDYQLQAGGVRPGDEWLPGHLAGQLRSQPDDRPIHLVEPIDDDDSAGRNRVQQMTFSKATCLQCNTLHKNRRTPQITDYMTRGDAPFSQLMGQLIKLQNPVPNKAHLPNKGKKILAFSDSRSRAAKLATNIQDSLNYDELRNLVLNLIEQDWYKSLPHKIRTLEYLYATFVLHMANCQLEPFAGTGDDNRNARNTFAYSRINIIAAHASLLFEHREDDRVKIHDELYKLICSSNDDLTPEAKAESVNQEFVDSAPRGVVGEFSQAATRYYAENDHRKFIRKMRSYLTNALLQKPTNDKKSTAVQNLSTGNALGPKEKRLLFGVMFDPDHYNENFIPNIISMRDRLTELGITFEVNDDIKTNPFTRLNTILGGNDAPCLKKKGWSDEKHQTLMQDMRDIILGKGSGNLQSRISQMREAWHNEGSKRYRQANVKLASTPHTLGDLSKLADQIISVTNSDIFNPNNRTRHWENTQKYGLSNLDNGSPWEFSGSVADFLGSKDFSLSGLGLGYAGISDDVKGKIMTEHIGPFDPDNAEEYMENAKEFNVLWEKGLGSVLSSLVHWMTRPAFGSKDALQGKEAKGGMRCVLSVNGGRYSYLSMKSGPQGQYILKESWGIKSDPIEEKYNRLYEAKCGCSPEVSFNHVAAVILVGNDDQDAGGRQLVNPNAIELIPTLKNEDLVACGRCGHCMPIIDEAFRATQCDNCEYDKIESYDPSSSNILNQRIEYPWRAPALKAAKSTAEDLSVLVIRAEEHTAQINTTRDDSEMYTSAEEFELLFQDVPFVVPSMDEAWSFAQAPVDLLSCTTTMEVGIDIGSLTCVALRTVPRKNSNYQQRVGRAGRGSAEVCIAVSWCDNQPHAQNYFEKPESMLKHPDQSPVIYLDNESIISRHINAAIFQAFFKRMNYDIPTRTFVGMGESEQEANLMESMGILEDFFDSISQSVYTFTAFKNWLGGHILKDEDSSMSWANVKPQIEGLIPFDSNLELSKFVDELNEFLEDTKNKLDAEKEEEE